MNRKDGDAPGAAQQLDAALGRMSLHGRSQQQANVTSYIPLPAHWEAVDPRHRNRVLVHLQATNPSHATELNGITVHFQSTMPAAVVHSVHRIQNESQYLNFERRKRELQKAGTPYIEHPRVYHGTRANHPRLIYESDVGFDPGHCASRLPGSRQPVVWFARDAKYSDAQFAFPIGPSSVLPFHPPTLPPQYMFSVYDSQHRPPGYTALLVARILQTENWLKVPTDGRFTIAESSRTQAVALIIYTTPCSA